MTTSLNVSRQLDETTVELLLALDSTATALQVPYCIVGAFARDVVLGLCFGIPTGRATRDIDFGLMLRDWNQFEQLRDLLLQTPEFLIHPRIAHRLVFKRVRELDIVPFGNIERRSGELAWPPDFSVVMSTVGLRQARATAIEITIATDRRIPFASPAALALLKFFAWSDRGKTVGSKDASDLALLLTHYLQAGNEQRLYDEYSALLDEEEFDLETAGARILGSDMATLAGTEICPELIHLLERSTSIDMDEPLIRALPLQYDRAKRLLGGVLKGLRTKRP